MRKLTALTALTLAFAVPAFASPITLEFAPAAGEATVVTLNDNGTFVFADETTGSYTIDAAGDTICGLLGGQNVCANLSAPLDQLSLGEGVTFTTTSGVTGTVTLVFAAQ